MRQLRIGITGSPATGKRTLGLALTKELGLPFLSLNEVAKSGGYLVPGVGGEPLLDSEALRRVAAKILPKGGYVVAGVYLAESIPTGLMDYVIVLRCNPLILARRYEERGYDEKKKKENLTAEFLDSCLEAALQSYGKKVREVDSTGKEAAQVLGEVLPTLRRGAFRVGVVDWLSLVGGPEDLVRFMI